jgi:hypothetical protein
MDKFQIVDVPGLGEVEFPDSMSDADVVAAVRKLTSSAGKPSDVSFEDQGAPRPKAAPEDYKYEDVGAGAPSYRTDADKFARAGNLAWSGLAKGALSMPAVVADGLSSIYNKFPAAQLTGPLPADRGPRMRATIDRWIDGAPEGVTEHLLSGGAELMGGALSPTPNIPVKPPAIAGRQYVVPGETGGVATRAAEKIVGKTGREAVASRVNAPTLSGRISRELGLPENTELTPEVIRTVRDKAGEVYAKVRGLPTPIVRDGDYVRELAALDKPAASDAPKAVRELAARIRAEIDDALGTRAFTADEMVVNMKQLRTLADDETDPAFRRVLRGIADAQHKMLERNVPDRGLVKELAAARTRIAQTYDLDKALTKAGDEVDARKLAARRLKRPMTGGLDDAADFAGHNPGAAKPPSTLGDEAGGNILADAAYALLALKATGSSTAAIGGFLARGTTRPMLRALYERAATQGNAEAAEAAARVMALAQSGRLTPDKAKVAAGALAVLSDYATKQQEQK